MIKCDNLDVSINGIQLLSNVSFALNPQSVTAILGANGAGKSTLLKALLGIIKPSKGVVSVEQQPLLSWSEAELASKRAYMSQSGTIRLTLPVYEYLALARHHCQESQHATDMAVEKVIAELSLEVLARRSINQLSGGEWQRVELARVWCQLLNDKQFHDTLLILDEPSSALDIHQTQNLYRNLIRYTQGGGTVLIVEHDINLASRFCDQLVLLKNGKILSKGAISDVFTTSTLNACFDVSGEVVKKSRENALSFIL